MEKSAIGIVGLLILNVGFPSRRFEGVALGKIQQESKTLLNKACESFNPCR